MCWETTSGPEALETPSLNSWTQLLTTPTTASRATQDSNPQDFGKLNQSIRVLQNIQKKFNTINLQKKTFWKYFLFKEFELKSHYHFNIMNIKIADPNRNTS